MAEFWTTDDVAAYVRAPAATIRYWRHIGDGPPGFKLGKRVLYDRAVVERWVADRAAASNTRTGARVA